MARRGSPKSRERVSRGAKRGLQLRRERLRARPRDLERWRQEGLVAQALRPIVDIAEEEAREITEALGGVEAVTPQQRILVEDLCAVGIGLRTNLALFVQDADPELSSRIATLAGARRQSLLALGLGRFEKELNLASYLQQKSAESALCGTNGAELDSRSMDASEDASVAAKQRNGAEREQV